MPVATASNRVLTLRSLIQLLVGTSEVVIKEWEAEEGQYELEKESPTFRVPSHELFEARRVVRGACEMCIDLVEDPRQRLQKLAETFAMSQALETTLRAGVPDILRDAEVAGGISATKLSQRTGIDEKKLVRVMRLLSTGGIYEEVGDVRFANSNMSRLLVGIRRQGQYSVSSTRTKLWIEALEYLPETLLDPEMTSATSATEAAFQKAQATSMTLWDFIDQEDKSNAAILELREIAPVAMIGAGQLVSHTLIAGKVPVALDL
ncbi:hypothetical protein DAEQUDRAFT_807889 [Daedalea quercina L-15889]|uniref:O-methyltransferase dimerisation domain-containing protein n=1 Tax=Daedalea quercina L-15889 TaxID=1314783 RepID=A0A165U0L5_9APHY|nr:hypothetical protein DAEQUDRAFT_807889 [Daedalea quercina L-15889]